MNALFTARLPALYARLGDDATFAHAGEAAVAVKVMINRSPGGGLDGMAALGETVLRMPAASAPAGVARGDLFVIDGATWVAREAGLPLLDGAELQVPLALKP